MANTRPPDEDKVRSVWTATDEAKLQELVARKQRIMSEHEQRVHAVAHLLGIDEADFLVAGMIQNADAVCAALKPFCKE